MKKGTGSIVFGWLLVAMQIMALMGSQLDNGFAQLSMAGLVGYFLPGILGVILLYSGYKKRNRWKENNSEENPDTLKMDTERIHNHDIQEKKTIAKFCGKCGTRLDSNTGTCPNRNCSEYVVLKKTDGRDSKKSPKRPLVIAIAVAVIALICYLAWMFWPCSHEWTEATCSTRKTCKLCGETEGETRAHAWVAATCTAPRTCKLCGMTLGTRLYHTNSIQERYTNIQDRTMMSVIVCSQCGKQLDIETETLSSFVQYDLFVFTPREFIEYFATIAEKTVANFSYSIDESSSGLIISLNDGEYTVSMTFFDRNAKTIADLDAHNVWGVGFMGAGYHIETYLPILAQVCDVSINKNTAVNMTNQLIREVKAELKENIVGSTYTQKNDINYKVNGTMIFWDACATASFDQDFLES